MDAKVKFREAIRNSDEALAEVVKTEDRGKREILERVRGAYRRLARLLEQLIGR
jgi:hypothetical protein